MTFQSKKDIKINKLIIERGKELASLLVDDEKDYILTIVERSKKNLYELGCYVVCKPTKRQLSNFEGALKLYIINRFFDKNFYKKYSNIVYEITQEFYDAINKTNFSDELRGNWILVMQNLNTEKESKHIDKELRLFIRDELINEFKQQNKQLIQKYGL